MIDKDAPDSGEDQELAPAAAEPSIIDRLIDAWHAEHFHGTRLGNDTELWNQVMRAKEDLKARLAKLTA